MALRRHVGSFGALLRASRLTVACARPSDEAREATTTTIHDGGGHARPTPRRLDPEAVEDAYRRARPHLATTPLCRAFANRGPGLWLKLENRQPTGSYKVRGALRFVERLAGTSPTGVVAASAGNHALGMAFAASVHGLAGPLVVCVPRTAPKAKLERLRESAVELRLVGSSYDEAHAEAERLAASAGYRYADPVEDLEIAAGHGTLALELLDQHPGLRRVIVPVGGGALISGVATAIRSRAPRVRICAAQSETYPALRESLAAGRALHAYPNRPTLADGLAGGIGSLVFAHRDLIDEVVTVSEREIGRAMLALLDEGVVAEGAGAVAAAAWLSHKVEPSTEDVAIVSGGNVDSGTFDRLREDRFS